VASGHRMTRGSAGASRRLLMHQHYRHTVTPWSCVAAMSPSSTANWPDIFTEQFPWPMSASVNTRVVHELNTLLSDATGYLQTQA
jgi:hypothetical protein